MKQMKKSQNHDSPDLYDSYDSQNQVNQYNHKNQGSDNGQAWEIKKLGEVYDVRDGTHDSPKYTNEGYALITSKNLKNDCLNYDNVNYITKQDYISINKRSKVDVGDVLFAMIGTIGNPIVIKDEPDFAIKNVALFKVPKNQDSYFLKFYLDSGSVIERMTKDAKGATQKFVGLGYLRNFPIPLPPLPEQQRIVSILDKAFSAIERSRNNAEQNLKNAKELFESYLQGVFENGNWEMKKLNEITEVKDGTHDSPKYIKEGIPFVTQKNIKTYGLSFDDTKFITDTDHEKFFKRSNVTFGDILISMIGANRGMAAIVDDKRVFSIKNVGLIKSSDNINMNYLLYF